MRKVPPSQNGADKPPQPISQTQSFPNPQQFPPEQQGAATQGQPPIQGPRPALPVQGQPAAQQPAPQKTQLAPAQLAPSGLALQPATPPRVSYAGGQLTVVANNSSLSGILVAIERTTGARLEGAQPDAERVFGQFGPGTPRQVLNLLLTGSHFDFILTGAIDDPGGVQRIMLSPHGGSPLGAQASNKAEARQNAATPAQEEEETNEVAPPPMPEPQPAPQVTQSEPQQGGQPGAQPQVKTPEQLLQELQRLRQQQQQQQQNAPSPR